MIRVVLDTNILISALLSRQGPPAQIFLMTIIDPNLQLCVSGHIFEEYEEVMRRRRFNRSETEIGATLGAIRANALWVRPAQKLSVCSDPDDDKFWNAHRPQRIISSPVIRIGRRRASRSSCAETQLNQ
jgi:uncharacterized protein